MRCGQTPSLSLSAETYTFLEHWSIFGTGVGFWKPLSQVQAFFWRVSFIVQVEQGELWINRHTEHKNNRSKPTNTVHEVLPLPLRWQQSSLMSSEPTQYRRSFVHKRTVWLSYVTSANGTKSVRSTSAPMIKSSLPHLVLRGPHNQALLRLLPLPHFNCKWQPLGINYRILRAPTRCLVNAFSAFLIRLNSSLSLSRPCSGSSS